jgi:hypothetical protein
MKLLSNLRKSAGFWSREYSYVTAGVALEPWERRMVNASMSCIAATAAYTSYSYLWTLAKYLTL